MLRQQAETLGIKKIDAHAQGLNPTGLACYAHRAQFGTHCGFGHQYCRGSHLHRRRPGHQAPPH